MGINISKKLLAQMGLPAWKEFWVWLATYVKEQEKAFKGRPGMGKLKAEAVIAAAHAKLAPYIPDIAESMVFAWLDGILKQAVAKLNAEIGTDWVTDTENLEHLVAVYFEPFLGVDLDEDGKIGNAPVTVVLVLAILTGLGAPESCHARSRRLVEHNVFNEKGEVSPAPVEPGAPPPASATVGPQTALPDIRLPAISTWAGWRTNGRGNDTWDGGLAATVRKSGSDWGITGLLGKGGVGVGPSWKRVGVAAYWDGTLTASAFISAIQF